MTTLPLLPRIVRLAPVFVLLVMAGCQSKPAANVQLRAMDQSQKMSQKFTKAYYAPGGGGAYDIVLVEQAMSAAESRGYGDSIATEAASLTHVLHIRVLWKPKKAIRPDSPTATNASVHWSVIAGDGSGRIDYDGVGFANVYGSGEQITTRLRNVSLKTAGKSGVIGDPIGASRLDASFKAQRDPRMVKSLLNMTRPATASASADQYSPPPRTPVP